jgi:hypothetical protein
VTNEEENPTHQHNGLLVAGVEETRDCAEASKIEKKKNLFSLGIRFYVKTLVTATAKCPDQKTSTNVFSVAAGAKISRFENPSFDALESWGVERGVMYGLCTQKIMEVQSILFYNRLFLNNDSASCLRISEQIPPPADDAQLKDLHFRK